MTKASRVLHLHLRKIYFDEIKAGTKAEEYRQASTYWGQRLARGYDEICLYSGYPKRDDTTRMMRRKFVGYTFKTITHPHFGSDPVGVFAIDVTVAL